MFSFILPAYKSEFLDLAINSILNQTIADFELVIVNDASPYDVASNVMKYDDNRISYYENNVNIGGNDLVKQWNTCIKYAKGEYVILASDDDIFSSDYLRKMSQLIVSYPDCDVFGCRKRIINSSGRLVDMDGYMGEYMSFFEFADRLYSGSIYSSIPNYIFRKSALDKNEGFVNFPLAWYSDDATILRLAHNGIGFSNELLFSFRFSDSNISSLINRDVLKRKIYATIEFHKWFNTEIPKVPIRTESDQLYAGRLKCVFDAYIARKTRYLAMSSRINDLLLLLINRRLWECVSRKELLKILISRIFN